ncbi:hypothetical protein [Paraferrimonas sp. SM1919]|nr:hypothetical protein [Paraferrimonas sp. SM1919]
MSNKANGSMNDKQGELVPVVDKVQTSHLQALVNYIAERTEQ